MQLHKIYPRSAGNAIYVFEPETITGIIAIKALYNVCILSTDYPEYESWVKENPKEKIRPFFERVARNIADVLKNCDLKLGDIWNASRTDVPKMHVKKVDETFTRLKEIYIRRPRLMYTL